MGRNQRLVAGAKGVPETVQVVTVVSNDRTHPNSTEEVGGGSGRCNQLTTSSERLGGGGVLTNQGVTTLNLDANNEVEGTSDIILLDPVERPQTTVLEGSGEARGRIKGQLGDCLITVLVYRSLSLNGHIVRPLCSTFWTEGVGERRVKLQGTESNRGKTDDTRKRACGLT